MSTPTVTETAASTGQGPVHGSPRPWNAEPACRWRLRWDWRRLARLGSRASFIHVRLEVWNGVVFINVDGPEQRAVCDILAGIEWPARDIAKSKVAKVERGRLPVPLLSPFSAGGC
ncbi:hypothetical protein JCM18899A_39370 [Nocardioides sp. AN3]